MRTVQVNAGYKKRFGFSVPSKYVFKTRKGLDEKIVEQISEMKGEPRWMREFRLNAYRVFREKPTPTWGVDLSGIDYDDIYYFLKPTDKEERRWEDVPKEMKNTFDRLGIPEAERKHLAGVKAQFDSSVVYSSLMQELEEQGIIFLSTDEALQKHPEFFEQYFGKVIPSNDNKFAALNSAVWSGGSFVYIPKGVKVKRPLQAYFRINAMNMGQFERTLIVADEGSEAHYVEGCFTKGHKITTNPDYKNIEDVKVGDRVLTHGGLYQNVHRTQERYYTGNLYKIAIYGLPFREIEVTEEHPFLAVRRTNKKGKNETFIQEWVAAKDLVRQDYLAVPVNKNVATNEFRTFEVTYKDKQVQISVSLSPEFFRLIGYYLAEGSIDDRGYLKFSFNILERAYVRDIKNIVKKLFGVSKSHEFTYKDKNGIELVFSSAKTARIFKEFGISAAAKRIPQWAMLEDPKKQKELIKGYYRGDGSYFNKLEKNGLKENFRMNTVSELLALQVKDVLLRMGIFAFINKRDRSKEGRQALYTVGVGGEFMIPFGKLVGVQIKSTVRGHRRASMFFADENHAYAPIKRIQKRNAKDVPVYNFSVENDESYVINSVAAHNCTSPVYTKDSLHAAVVEVIVKKGARFRYTTIQNWSNDVYNLVTKRARVEENAIMEWVDGNLGSKKTQKYPSCYLVGKGAHGEVLSIAYAGKGQHQDAGGKMIHIAPNTTSQIISKSVSRDGGRTSYRGMVAVTPSAKNAKSHVECDALILDSESASDTFPVMRIDEDSASIEHEATVSKIGQEKLFYLMSRGLTEAEAMSMMVSGFIEPIVKQLPLEYAVELNRLIELEMEGSVG